MLKTKGEEKSVSDVNLWKILELKSQAVLCILILMSVPLHMITF